jgi:hypothetical protein
MNAIKYSPLDILIMANRLSSIATDAHNEEIERAYASCALSIINAINIKDKAKIDSLSIAYAAAYADLQANITLPASTKKLLDDVHSYVSMHI